MENYSTNYDNYELINKLINKVKEPIELIELSGKLKNSLSKDNKEANVKIINILNK